MGKSLAESDLKLGPVAPTPLRCVAGTERLTPSTSRGVLNEELLSKWLAVGVVQDRTKGSSFGLAGRGVLDIRLP